MQGDTAEPWGGGLVAPSGATRSLHLTSLPTANAQASQHTQALRTGELRAEGSPAKDTRGPLCAAHQVQAGRDHVRHPPAPRQMLAHGHLEEVERGVQAVLVQLQLVPQVVDLTPP